MKDIETPDLCLAAYLRALGYALDSIEKVGNRGTFFFKDVPDSVYEDFNMGRAKIEPNAFHSAIKTLTSAARRVQ
jgi:hypothetical protein